jgi:hypothetical protein
MHEVFDYDDVHLELENLTKDFGLVVGSISTPHGPFTFESIATPNDFDEEAKIAWEVLKAQLILNQKAWVPIVGYFSIDIFWWQLMALN